MKAIFTKKTLIAYFLSILIIALLQFSCGISNNSNTSSNTDRKTIQPPTIITITALVFFQTIDNNQQLILIENPESKSRISYECINLSQEMRKKLLPLNNTKIIAEVRILETITPWFIKVELVSYSK